MPDDATLIAFARSVLQILEETKEWDADTADEIASVAYDNGLAENGPDGLFQITR